MLAIDIHLHDTYFVVAHFHYVMVGSTVFAFFGGLHYWWPKMTGKMYDESTAKKCFWLIFIGYNGVFLPQFVLGSRGMPRRYYDYLPQYQFLHQVSTVFSWILAIGGFWMLFMFFQSLRHGKKAPRNPWNSAAYEWGTPTPPPLENFPTQPTFTRGPYDYHLATDAEVAED
jgi:cytochrome c oxidase subunit 1